MKVRAPCQILHLDLALDYQFPIRGNRYPSCYQLFWWNHIPLGQLFTQTLDEKHWVVQVAAAIRPAILEYDQSSIHSNKILAAWEKGDYPAFVQGMTELFSGFAQGGPGASEVSVVICTRNQSAALEGCLEALQHQQDPPLEILVVDNAPVDDSTRQLVTKFPGVIYCLEPRAGLDIARNTGVRKSRGRIIAYTDDDTRPHPDWTRALAGAFARKRIMGVTGLVLAARLDTEAQLIFETNWSFNRGFLPMVYDRHYFNAYRDSAVPVWEIGAGANMALRREIFHIVGYFDERLDVGAAGCSGDSEYWYRILAEGYEIDYEPRAVVFHDHRREMQDLRRQIFRYMRGFTTALFIQNEKYHHRGNLHHLYRHLPLHYLRMLALGVRHRFNGRYSTIWQEIGGCLSGIRYYREHRQKAPITEMHPG
ncbi:MAG TPA: glycosyltransferase [Chitinophagaceae bacterium]|nr:glycosyltransferase [Chitinophagaceae bacterium]